MCSGRIDGSGLLVIVTVGDAITKVGHLFGVIDPRILGLASTRGRAPTAEERAAARAPYRAPTAPLPMRERAAIPDELLAEQEAVRLARVEQQREPADLFRLVAA